MGKVVYITGAPATGKSTLCKRLAAIDSSVVNFCYSERLRDHINLRNALVLDESNIREHSAGVVLASDVESIDANLVQLANAAREGSETLIVDSHPVTKEAYGFRVTPFSHRQLEALGVDVIVCLYATPQVLAQRITAHPEGRPLPTEFELGVHVQTQISVAAQYSVIAGVPCYLLNSSSEPEILVKTVREIAGLAGNSI